MKFSRTLVACCILVTCFPLYSIAQSTTDDTDAASQIYCPHLSTTFKKGYRDSNTNGQVSELQQFLSDFYSVEPTQVITGFFGNTTNGYVKRFQGEQNLPIFGVVGTLTRAAIARVCTSSQDATATSSPSAVITPGSIQCPAVVPPSCTGIVATHLDPHGCAYYTCTPAAAGYAQLSYYSQAAYSPSCTPDATSPQTRTLACPAGQTGSLTQIRTSSCAATTGSPTWGPWQTTANTCVAPPVITASASASYQNTSPSNTIDANPASVWNAGGSAPQWIELDLGAPQTIAALSLSVVQDPAGNTVHDIYAGSTPNPTTLVKEIASFTTDGQVLTPTFSPALTNVRYVRIVTTQSPSRVAWGTITFSASNAPAEVAPQFKTLADAHVQQFGYYASAVSGVGSGDYIDAVAPQSNVVFVRDDNQDMLIAKVKNARDHGLGVVLAVQNLFFPWASSHLYSDSRTSRFDALWSALSPYRSTIKGFYLFDEPFSHNAATDGSWATVSDADLTANINWAASYLHTVEAGIPSISIFSYPEIARSDFFSTLLPKKINWIGFDCYVAFGSACSTDAVQADFNNFARYKDPSEKIVLVPDAFWSSAPSAPIDALVAARLPLYQGFAASSPDVVAIYPFLYQTDTSQNLWGAQSLPVTAAALIAFFTKLLGP